MSVSNVVVHYRAKRLFLHGSYSHIYASIALIGISLQPRALAQTKLMCTIALLLRSENGLVAILSVCKCHGISTASLFAIITI